MGKGIVGGYPHTGTNINVQLEVEFRETKCYQKSHHLFLLGIDQNLIQQLIRCHTNHQIQITLNEGVS